MKLVESHTSPFDKAIQKAIERSKTEAYRDCHVHVNTLMTWDSDNCLCIGFTLSDWFCDGTVGHAKNGEFYRSY